MNLLFSFPSMIENRANYFLVYVKNINYLFAIGSFNKINCEYFNLNEINNNNKKKFFFIINLQKGLIKLNI